MANNFGLTPRLNRIDKNILINGGMEVAQRLGTGGNATVATDTNAYGIDRMRLRNIASVVTLTQTHDTSVPSGVGLTRSWKVSKTATGTLQATTSVQMDHFLEGYDCLPIYTSEFTVLFWVKSTVTGTRFMRVGNGTATHTYVRSFTISQANTWELKAVKFPALNTSPGTVPLDTARGAIISWSIIQGTNFQTGSLDQWVAGNLFAGVGEDATWLTGTTHDYAITGVIVAPGDWTGVTASTYQFVRCGRNFNEELALCQRYYEKSHDLAHAPGTGAGNFNGAWCGSTPSVTGGGDRLTGPHFMVRKRATPTVVIYNPNTAGTSAVYEVNTGQNKATTGFVGTGEHGVGQIGATGNSLIVNNTYLLHWTADAEL